MSCTECSPRSIEHANDVGKMSFHTPGECGLHDNNGNDILDRALRLTGRQVDPRQGGGALRHGEVGEGIFRRE